MLGSQISLMGKLSIIQQKNNFQVINTQYTIRHRNQVLYILVWFRFMVFNDTFNNISVICLIYFSST